MELTIEQLKELVPFKFELIRSFSQIKITELPKNTYFWETENSVLDGYAGYFNGIEELNGRLLIWLGKNCYTWRELEHKNHICHCPAIYKQLSGKNKDKLFHFNFYDAWKKYSNTIEDIQNSMKNDGRWFLPSYLPDYVK